jgi:type IV pilus assembly protein PilW
MKKRPLPVAFPSRQRGFSLTELMVAVVVGLVLTIVVSQVFLGNKDAFRTQDDASRIAENARFIQLILNRTARNTGYTYWNPGAGQQFKAAWTTPAFKPQLAGLNATGPNGSDEVTVFFYGSSQVAGGAHDGTVLTCHGVGVSDNTVINPASNRFFVAVSTVATGGDGRPALFCTSIYNNITVTRELVPGVESFQILYGEDKNADYVPDRWVPANAAGLDMTKVVALRVGVVLASPNINTATEADTRTYHVFGADYALEGSDTGTMFVPAVADNKRLRKLYSYTVALRNRVQ